MSFFNKAIEKIEAKLDSQGSRPSPNIPYLSKPTAPTVPNSSKPAPAYSSLSQQTFSGHVSTTYWQASFDPQKPVSDAFVQETGDWGWGNNELQNYIASPQNSFYTSSSNGNLLILRGQVQTLNPDPKHRYTSARLYTRQTLSRPSGYLEARINAPVTEGIWPAFWLLPADPFRWPEDGEIDIMEFWNGDRQNHSCLHWGQHNGEDWDKHRVNQTFLPDIERREGGVTFGFAWTTEGGGGRCIWYVDHRAVMKASKPSGTRPWADFRILLNMAMGGTVCGGRCPKDGGYDMVVHELKMCESPPGNWQGFEASWRSTPDGKPNS